MRLHGEPEQAQQRVHRLRIGESWEDCERKVKLCVKEVTGIALLEMERTYRVGKAIGVRFFLQAEDVGADKCAQAEDLQRLRQHLRQRRLFGDSSEETSSLMT